MSNIPVISHNVIRQSLEWMGFPDPVSVRTISNFTFPDGKYQARLDVTWQASDLLCVYTGVDFNPGLEHGLLVDLRECFASDVHPIDCQVDRKAGTVTVILSCVVRPFDA